MTHFLHVQTLGGFQLLYDGELVVVRSARVQSLLTYLLLYCLHPQPRQQIAYRFWPESSETQARANLRKRLHQLRKTVPEASRFFQIESNTIQWRMEAAFTFDVAQFEEAIFQAKTAIASQQRVLLERAVELYGGDLLPACYDDWIRLKREQLRQTYGNVLDDLVQLLETQSEHRHAIYYARQLCRLAPLREATYRQLMRLYSLSGDRGSAIETFRHCEQRLGKELAVEPSAATRDLYAQLLTTDIHKPPRHNLPDQLTSFVGREEALADVAQRLQDKRCRLLTLIGLGGVGKTRLALQAAIERLGEFEHGVYFVSLAAVSSPNLLHLVLGEALNFVFYGPRKQRQQLLDYLREKQVLLVLDNFEHLLEATALLVDILDQAPAVKLLVTSRQRLHLQGEWLMPVEGMSFPKADDLTGAETFSAVKLFEQRAQRIRPDFTLTETNKSAVVRICRLVEGLPLAIELAAAWVRILTCSEIADEIERNLGFLTTSLQDVPERHRSLRAVFDHSWNRLSPAEQTVFQNLSVFQGSFDRKAAESVAGAFLPFLLALADRSLLRRTAEGRYILHELLHWYSSEKLATVPQAEGRLRQQHGRYYAIFLQQKEEQLKGTAQKRALEAIGLDIDNIEAAWRWAVTSGQWPNIEKALGSFFHFYRTRGWYQRGEEAINLALTALTTASPSSEAKDQEDIFHRLVARQAVFSHRLGRSEQARERLEQSLERFRILDGAEEMAFCLGKLAQIATDQGDYDQAQAWGNEALALYRRLQDTRGLAGAYNILGRIAYSRSSFTEARILIEQALMLGRIVHLLPEEAEGLRLLGVIAARQSDYTTAVTHFRQALTIYRELGHQRGVSQLLNNLGTILLEQGDYAGANENYSEALHNLREIGDRAGESIVLNNMGLVCLEQGDYSQAKTHFIQALQIKKTVGNRRGEAKVLNNLGIIAFRLGQYESAKQLYEHSLILSREIEDQRGQSLALSNLSLLLHYVDDNVAARACAQQALTLAKELGDRIIPDYALTRAGHALAGLGQWEAAIEAYQQALALRRELKQKPLIMVTLAGLARLAQAMGNLDQAQDYVAEILDLLETTAPEATLSTFEPFRVYLTCHRLLAANQDERASSILQTAYRLLQEQAARITDEKLRRSFLENVPEHQDIARRLSSG